MKNKKIIFGLVVALLCLASAPVLAEMAEPWQMGFQKAFSPSAEKLHEFHNLLLWIICLISLFVLALLIYVVVKFNRKANPTPSKTSHNVLLEIAWTAVPVLILVVITIPSLRVLYFLDHVEEADMTIKVTGNQWYWSYSYPDQGDIEFDSYIVEKEDLEEGQPRLLTVDNALVVPAGKNIRLLMSSADVIHSWAVPSLGVKLDSVPGRLNETWVKITEPGVYYGQCSELCGVNHGFMPIMVKAVSEQEFAAWLVEAKEEFSSLDIKDKDIELAKSINSLSQGETSYE